VAGRPHGESGRRLDARGADLRRRHAAALIYGNQVATPAITGVVETNNNPLWIGGNEPYGEYFDGLIDDVRVYNRALTQADIQTDMNTPINWTAVPTLFF
jgi:hypothetical protein